MKMNMNLHEIKGLNEDGIKSSINEKHARESQEVDLNDHYIYISYPVDANKKQFNRLILFTT